MQYSEMTREALASEYESLKAAHAALAAAGHKLDLSRGKPASDQLDLSDALLEEPIAKADCLLDGGLDARNYGVPLGLPEMRAFWSSLTGIPSEQIYVGGNSSLSLMYDTVVRALLFGVVGSEKPWSAWEKRKRRRRNTALLSSETTSLQA